MTAIRLCVYFADTVMLVRAVTDFLQLVAKVVDLECVLDAYRYHLWVITFYNIPCLFSPQKMGVCSLGINLAVDGDIGARVLGPIGQ